MPGLNKIGGQLSGLLASFRPLHGACDVHGVFSAMVPAHVAAVVCPSCLIEAEAGQLRAQRLERLVACSGIPRRFLAPEARFADLVPVSAAQAEVVGLFKRWVAAAGRGEEAGNVVLVGGTGTGKTHMACAAALNLARRAALAVRYTTAEEMKNEICAAWGDAGRSEDAEIRRFAAYPLLILDEVDIFATSGPAARMLNQVIDKRYGAGLPTVFISNETPEALEDLLGGRAISRIFEHATTLRCSWGDYRAMGKTQAA